MGILDRLGLRAPSPPAAAPRADSVLNRVTGLGGVFDKGSTYNNRPDVLRQPLTADELTALWHYNGLARRIVRLLPAEATRRGWHIDDTGDEERRLHLVSRIREGMTWGRLYGAGPVLMVTEDDIPAGFRGANRAQWLAEPLDLARVGKVHALHAFDPYEAIPDGYEWDPLSPAYRSPQYWLIHTASGHLRVHHSRVLHFRGAMRPPSWRHGYRGGDTLAPDDSVLQSLWDEVQRLCSTTSAGAVLAHEIRESVLKVGGLEGMEAGDQQEALESRLRFLAKVKSVLGIVLIGPDDEYSNRSNAPTGFGELSAEAKSMLCGVLGWPGIVLFGDAPAGFSTDGASGWQTFNRVVVDYQEEARPLIERAYEVIFAAQDGPTGGVIPDVLEIDFLPLDEPSEKEKAETRKLVAETDALYLDRTVVTPEDVTRARFGEEGWQLDMFATPVDDEVGEGFEEAFQTALDRADDSAIVLVRVDLDLWRQARALVSDSLRDETDPHVTVLYLGAGLTAQDLAEVIAEVQAAARAVEPFAVGGGRLGVLGEDRAVVAEFQDAWPLADLHDRLFRALAHVIRAKQYPRFRPHMTLGYAMGDVDRTALLEADVSELRVPVAEVEVRHGSRLVATLPLGAGE